MFVAFLRSSDPLHFVTSFKKVCFHFFTMLLSHLLFTKWLIHYSNLLLYPVWERFSRRSRMRSHKRLRESISIIFRNKVCYCFVYQKTETCWNSKISSNLNPFCLRKKTGTDRWDGLIGEITLSSSELSVI